VAQVLLDTTFFIDLRRGDLPARRVWERIRRGQVTAAYSSVTPYELWLSKTLDRSDELFFRAIFTLLEEAPLHTEAAIQTALWLRDLPRRSRERRLRDAFIAASARLRGETVYTRNTTDIRRYWSNVRRY
jgi:predicted nucleic acid-binding protein